MTSEAAAVRMDVVAEPPSLGEWTPPWPVATLQPGEWIVLDGAASPEMVGSVVAALAGRGWEAAGTPSEVLRAIAEDEHPQLAGGIRIRDSAGGVVEPGCCCGVEYWAEWLDVSGAETSPWMGHDPWGWVERDGDVLRVCSGPVSGSEQGYGPAESIVLVPLPELPRLLEGVRADLEAFAARLREWAVEIDAELGPAVAARFEAAFVRAW